jgi:hypothetical protein
MTIVTTHYHYKRPPKKRAKAAAITGPAIVTANSKRTRQQIPNAVSDEPMKSVIVTARNPRGRFADVPELTLEEVQRRGDAADALWRELVRRARETKE